jgi:hypothetical protein
LENGAQFSSSGTGRGVTKFGDKFTTFYKVVTKLWHQFSSKGLFEIDGVA